MWTPTLLRLGEGRVERGTRARRGWMEPSARRSGWRAKQSCASRARPMWGRRGSRCSPGRIRTARMEHCRRSARGGVARRHAGGAAGRHGGAAQGAEARRVRPSCSKVSAVGVAGEGSRRLPLPGGCRARGGARPSGGDRARGRLRAAPLLGESGSGKRVITSASVHGGATHCRVPTNFLHFQAAEAHNPCQGTGGPDRVNRIGNGETAR